MTIEVNILSVSIAVLVAANIFITGMEFEDQGRLRLSNLPKLLLFLLGAFPYYFLYFLIILLGLLFEEIDGYLYIRFYFNFYFTSRHNSDDFKKNVLPEANDKVEELKNRIAKGEKLTISQHNFIKAVRLLNQRHNYTHSETAEENEQNQEE